ncbi:replication factor A protein 2 [Agyrium rufum]|nr:replication factor A protein 2 [Agyrium rufum]
MDYNGYNNNQYNTSYGAQGGAAGGGFFTGSQGGSQPTGKALTSPKTCAPANEIFSNQRSTADTLRPVTIRQLLGAIHPHPDAEVFTLDDSDITQVTFCAQIRNISKQTTNMTYKMDDGTGTIEVKKWSDSGTDGDDDMGGDNDDDEDEEMADDEYADPNHNNNGGGARKKRPKKPRLKTGGWARVCGVLKQYNNRRHVGSHILKPITDFNEVQYHFLEATYVHLYVTRGPPASLEDQQNQQGGQQQQQQQDNGMGFDGAGGQQQQQEDGGAGGTMTGQLLQRMSVPARRVYEYLRTQEQTNEGLHAQMIAVDLQMEMQDVVTAADQLLGEGLIWETVGEMTYAVM